MRISFRLGILAACLLAPSIAAAGTQKATATYGNYYYYSDGTVLIKDAESDWIGSDGESGAYDVVMDDIRFCSVKSGMICIGVRWGRVLT